jgi:hypothetical protein
MKRFTRLKGSVQCVSTNGPARQSPKKVPVLFSALSGFPEESPVFVSKARSQKLSSHNEAYTTLTVKEVECRPWLSLHVPNLNYAQGPCGEDRSDNCPVCGEK